MVEESESYSDMEMDCPPKLTFDELRAQVLREPKNAIKRLDYLKTLYYYSKDTKKHARIIKVLFWALIVPLLQDKTSNRTALYGLKTLNELIANSSSHKRIIKKGLPQTLTQNYKVDQLIWKAAQARMDENIETANVDSLKQDHRDKINEMIGSRQNPVRILVNIILRHDQSIKIMIEGTKAIKNLSKTEEVIHMLMKNNDLLEIIKTKFYIMDSLSQEYTLETVSAACAVSDKYRTEFVKDPKFIEILLSQVKSISKSVTFQTLRICRQLAKDEENLKTLQGTNLRLSHELIYAFQWLDALINQADEEKKDIPNPKEPKNTQNQFIEINTPGAMRNIDDVAKGASGINQTDVGVSDLIFREISKAFEYILKYYDQHKRLMDEINKNIQIKNMNGISSDDKDLTDQTENQIIETIVQLGRSTRDPKTTLNAATSLAHITEVLNCNPQVLSDLAIDFMIDMLKDTKNIKNHRQGCRYFANLSFYKEHCDKLVKKEIATYLLKAIDGHLDDDTIKHSAIALANLSSHEDFMKPPKRQSLSGTIEKEKNPQSSKTEKWMIKPLIHLLDSAQNQKLNLIQSACITLCNMASKPSLHKHFVYEPEISTIKNCLANPIDKGQCNELTRFMIKLVCNLTKNPSILPKLLKKGFLEILFDLLNHEREKEIFGNVVTAIAYLSVQKEAQEMIIRSKVMNRILETKEIHPVDQKMIIIALTTMLFNGIQLQREFIKFGGLGKMLVFLKEQDKIFYQLSCKCFSILSENEENLEKMIESECLNNIIISCLKNKDIDLETLKEITKIFINLILWRKLKPETIETTCCLCDIGLMIDDLDMNILAIFCLNALSEDEKNQKTILESGFSISNNKSNIISGKSEAGKRKQQSMGGDQSVIESIGKKNQGDNGFNHAQSIFSRINFLLDNHQNESSKVYDNIDSSKRELLVTLITSFYLNLARNKANQDFLLKLNLFEKLNNLMTKNQMPDQPIGSNTALCYTNTIFAKLLKYSQSRNHCIKEGGHNLFIQILKNKNNKHLFLETLDSIKLFLARRKDLSKFQEIPKHVYLGGEEENCQELNVSYLQVLAILSFEKKNHDSLKSPEFLKKLEAKNMFQNIFNQFDEMEKIEDEKNKKMEDSRLSSSKKDKEYLDQNSDGSDQSSSVVSSAMIKRQKQNKGKKRKSELTKTRQVELALSISIILSNLSNDEQYIETLLGVHDWEERYNEQRDVKLNDENGQQQDGSNHNQVAKMSASNFDDKFIMKQPEVDRIIGMLNLLSHQDPFISEQISILLANVSNSPYFRYDFISDRCIKSIIKILRFKSQSTQTEVSLLAILIVILNLSAMEKIVAGIENMQFLNSLQDIIKNEAKPLENRSIGLMAISNIFTLTKSSKQVIINEDTQNFAFEILKTWDDKLIVNDEFTQENAEHPKKNETSLEQAENKEVIKNLVYASLILFYNILLKDHREKEYSVQKDIIEKLIDILNNDVMDFFEDSMIVNVVLQLITLFTRREDNPSLFDHPKILRYVFSRLRSSDLLVIRREPETIKLAALSLSRLSSRFDPSKTNLDLFIREIDSITKHKRFDNFDYVMEQIQKMIKEDLNPDEEEELSHRLGPLGLKVKTEPQKGTNDEKTQIAKDTLKYLLNVLENITSEKITREKLDCSKLFKHVISSTVFNEKLDMEYKKSLIRIMFNLNFNLSEPHVLDEKFLKLLHKTYEEMEKNDEAKMGRKIISIVVVASALESNHNPIIKSNFYTQFKKNINEKYNEHRDANEEIELFGLVNIALNKQKLYKIYPDLKRIHRIAVKSDKIDFKTKVDLITEISKFIKMLSNKQGEKIVERKKGTASDIGGEEGVLEGETDENSVIKECLKALIFTLVRLTGKLPTENFAMFKYFLTAILDITKNLKNHLKYIIKINKIMDFLKKVLQEPYEFADMSNMSENFDDREEVLRFSLRMIVCDIYFNLKFEREFFKLDQIEEAISLLIEFSRMVLKMNLEKKHTLVSNTLRLLSQMITTIHLNPDAAEKIKKTGAISFVKEALPLSKDLQPCINIDALFCLNNLMNIQEIAEDPEFKEEIFIYNAFVIYFAYREQIELDECLITFLYSISKFKIYQKFLQNKTKVLFTLMQRHITPTPEQNLVPLESCRQKIFSTFHNLTENDDVCKELAVSDFIKWTNEMFAKTLSGEYESGNIHELAIKSLINICQHNQDGLDDNDNNVDSKVTALLENISKLYADFQNLAKQYALRLVTILTRQWGQPQLGKYLNQIISILSEFIKNCTQVVEIKLVLINLEKIAIYKTHMKKMSEDEKCKELIINIAYFLESHKDAEPEYAQPCIQLIKFCKKLSKQSAAHPHLIEAQIHRIALLHISTSGHSFNEMDEIELKSRLQTIQNVMRMVKHLFEGHNISDKDREDIVSQVKSHEDVINAADDVLKTMQNNNHELAVMIVNIIICFNSISNQMKDERVREWIEDFSQRLCDHSQPNHKTMQARSWYLEKYVFIIELLVTKNLDKVNKDMTEKLLEIYKIKEGHCIFSKTIWYKLLKILAHLWHLQDILKEVDEIDPIFNFIANAYEKTTENLSFLYFIKVVMLLTKKQDLNIVYNTSKYFQKSILENFDKFFQKNHEVVNDALTTEIVLYQIDYYKLLMNFTSLHAHLNEKKVVKNLIHMLKVHTEPQMVKAISSALHDASQTTQFYPDLLSDHSLHIILMKIINYNDPTKTENKASLELLCNCLESVMRQTKPPIKYLLATSILKTTESDINWSEKKEENIVQLLKVLNSNIQSLTADESTGDMQAGMSKTMDRRQSITTGNSSAASFQKKQLPGDMDQSVQSGTFSAVTKQVIDTTYTFEQYNGLSYKAHKYCFLAITNILIKTNSVDILYPFRFTHNQPKRLLLEVLMEESNFEKDPQMNLRFLALVRIALEQNQPNEKLRNHDNHDETLRKLIEFITDNIHKFRNILENKETYFYEIPPVSASNKKASQKESSAIDLNRSVDNADALLAVQGEGQGFGGDYKIVPSAMKTYKSTAAKITGRNELILSDAHEKELPHQNSLSNANHGGNLSPSKAIEQEEPSTAQYFFEADAKDSESHLLKIDAIRISLCFSINILYQLTTVKKSPARQLIFNRIDWLFKYLHPFILHQDVKSLKYVLYVIKIIDNCADSKDLHKNLLDQKECVPQLIKVAWQALNYDGDFREESLAERQQILIQILSTFQKMSEQNDIPQFDQQMTKHNAKDLIDKLKENESDEISKAAATLYEALQDQDETESQEQNLDIHAEMQPLIEEESVLKQAEVLECILEKINKKQVKLGKSMDDVDLVELIPLLKQDRKHERKEFKTTDSRDPKQEVEDPIFEAEKSVKLSSLKILYHVYQTKWINSKASPTLHYTDDINDLYWKRIVKEKNHEMPKPSEPPQRKDSQQLGSGHKVACVIECKATFEAFKKVVDQKHHKELYEPVVDIILVYSQSTYKLAVCAVDYVMPIFNTILDNLKESSPDDEMLQQAPLTRLLSKMVESIIYFLMKAEDKVQILKEADTICSCLLRLVQHDNVFRNNHHLLLNLEHLIKIVFHSKVKLAKTTGQDFIKFMLKGGIKDANEFKKLGVFSLYCIALGLQESRDCCNIDFFEDDEVLHTLMKYVKDKENLSRVQNSTQQKLRAHSDEIDNEEQFQELKKLRIVALQILVIVAEFQNQIALKDKHDEYTPLKASKLTNRIYVKESQGLLLLLIKRSLQVNEQIYSLDEMRLVARAFASLPASELIEQNFHVFDQSEVEENKKQAHTEDLLPPPVKTRHDKPHATTFKVSLMSYFNSLANIIQKFNDPQASYFALYSVLNFIYAVTLKKSEQLILTAKKKDKLKEDTQKMRITDLDYRILTACLVKSNLLRLALVQPHQCTDEDLMRISMKLLITIVFKAHNSRVMIGEPLNKPSSHIMDLYERLDLNIEPSKLNTHELMKSFIDKLHAFELQNLHKGGYVQFIHLVSQIVLQTTTPTVKDEQRLTILPTRGIMTTLIRSFCQSMDTDNINRIVRMIDTGSGAVAEQASKEQKMLLYKFFFFNYLFQVTGEELMDSLLTGDPSMYETYAKDLHEGNSDKEDGESSDEESVSDLKELTKSLLLLCETLRSKRRNWSFDCSIKPLKQGMVPPDNREKNADLNLSQHSKEEEKKVQPSEEVDANGQPIIGQDGQEQVIDEQEEKRKLLEQHRLEDEQMSSSLTIVKMTLNNLDIILTKVLESETPNAAKFTFNLSVSQLGSLTALLTDFEESGDIVEGVYMILEKFLRLARDDNKHPSVQVMENSQPLMKQAVKHAANYQCAESFAYLQTLIGISAKFKNKEEMGTALGKIAPKSQEPSPGLCEAEVQVPKLKNIP